MDIFTIVKIISVTIATFSFAGIIMWWFVQLTATTLADNYKKKIEHDFEKKLEGYKLQLEVIKANTLKYNDKQFELYIELWRNLQDLKFSCIDLWQLADQRNLRKFDVALKKTHRQIEITSILLEENHHKELSEIITNLQEYDNGKGKLIYAKNNFADRKQISEIIEFNRQRKDRCLEIIEVMKKSITLTLKGQGTP
jgi:hypothetical protein